MAKGSLTIFFALIMSAVMALIFAMSECIRIYELHDFAQEYTDMAVESAFSEYNPYLWDKYRILAIDLGYGSEAEGPEMFESRALEYCDFNANIAYGKNYARLFCEDCKVHKYGLLTDNEGAPVIALGAKAAKEGMAAQIIDGIQGKMDSINNIERVPVENTAKKGKDALSQALAALEQAKVDAENDDNPDTSADDFPEPETVEDNPLDAFDLLKNSFSKGVLSTVMDVEKVSGETAIIDELPSNRHLRYGNLNLLTDESMVDRVLFVDYLLTNYSYFSNEKNAGLKYELEYLVSGQESDLRNLTRVVEEILLVREAANYATIIKTPSMVFEAKKIATIIAGFSMNPGVIELVQAAIIASWAYAEATLDVRLILSGGKVPAIKTLDQWTSNVWNLSQVANVKFKARDCGTGLGYKEYLMAFLGVKNKNVLAMRALDVMEQALNTMEDYQNVRMDNMMFCVDVDMGYGSEEMFTFFKPNVERQQHSSGGYYFTKSKFLSY